MADLIDRQDVIDAFDLPIYNITGRENAERVIEYLKAVIQRIKDLPSAQPEIIRCKDCKHLFDDNKCPLRTWWTHTEEDFCSYAERKTDEADYRKE